LRTDGCIDGETLRPAFLGRGTPLSQRNKKHKIQRFWTHQSLVYNYHRIQNVMRCSNQTRQQHSLLNENQYPSNQTSCQMVGANERMLCDTVSTAYAKKV